ncbi:Beta-ketoacyl synthase, partial [Metarhizium majus ARSEF 297]
MTITAGLPLGRVAGTSTGVYTGSFGPDYVTQMYRDPDTSPRYASVGIGLSMLANWLSCPFNLRAPSIDLDTACSSGATAFDMACRALKDGSVNMAVVRSTTCNEDGRTLGITQPSGTAHVPNDRGAIKSNTSHLRGASGLAGIVKTILVLERGIIPPNANFEKLNPKIDGAYLRLKFPEEYTP